MSDSTCQVAIVGAGPYGLSIAAHLRARGVKYEIFGTPMAAWRFEMPKGMHLKSEGFASNLYDPEGRHTLKEFCARTGRSYADWGPAVPLDTFVQYGLDFQRRLVPNVQERTLVRLSRSGESYELEFADGGRTLASKVVVAVGTAYYRYIPDEFAKLPADLVSHSTARCDLAPFAGRNVTVLGGGASGLDLAALLHEVGAKVNLVVRASDLAWNEFVVRPIWRQWYPLCSIGGGDLRKRFYEMAPNLFRHLPLRTRLEIVASTLGPAGGHPVRKTVESLPPLLGHTIASTEVENGRLKLRVEDRAGRQKTLVTDHLIAATGFRVKLAQIGFLDDPLRHALSVENAAAGLSENFESAVPGLYFVGISSAPTFGPVMRFAVGARFTSRRLSKHLVAATSVRRGPALASAPVREAAE
jgi:cation diffusion facilitator CzcD-associated flavoprotein CzcO